MKIKVKELQALDAMLEVYFFRQKKNTTKELKRYYPLIKDDNLLVYGSCFRYAEDSHPYRDIQKKLFFDYDENYFFIACQNNFYELLSNSPRLYSIYDYPSLCLDTLLNVINGRNSVKYDDYKTSILYDAHILGPNIDLPFYQLDDSREYELVSLVTI